MDARYLVVIVLGLGVTAWSLPAAYRLRAPWHLLAALAALAGIIAILTGTLLLTVPGFFSR
jgi:hypothetical protein